MNITGFKTYPKSVIVEGGTTYALVRDVLTGEKYLAVQGNTGSFGGGREISGASVYPLSPENAAALRARLPWLKPVPFGLKPSAGFGDRLGLATPGHIWAARGSGFAPIFGQQSVRENARTGRTPQQVLDDAMWGVFQEGWREPWGADADHLKTTQDLDAFTAAGYSFFTIDPGEHVDNAAQNADLGTLKIKVANLPWDKLGGAAEEIISLYLNKTFNLNGLSLAFDELTLMRAMAKYGKAVAHTVAMNQYILAKKAGEAFDLEVSVDETDLPTSVSEHYYISSELTRLGVKWVSMAPRFIGRFEKGVDYIGDLKAFEEDVRKHAAVLKFFGNYKLSLHSGSDKFSVYQIVSRLVDGKVHLKTAGTSYLEALRVIAGVQPAFFRQLLDLGMARYEIDCASYHVSAQLSRVPAYQALPDSQLPELLDQFDTRQVLHVTFGSALAKHVSQIKDVIKANEDLYYQVLQKHFLRHLNPLKYV